MTKIERTAPNACNECGDYCKREKHKIPENDKNEKSGWGNDKDKSENNQKRKNSGWENSKGFVDRK